MPHRTEAQVLRQLTTGLGKSREMCLPQPSRWNWEGRAPCAFLLSLSADQEPSSQRLRPPKEGSMGLLKFQRALAFSPGNLLHQEWPLETRTHFTEVPAMSNGHSTHSSLGTEL